MKPTIKGHVSQKVFLVLGMVVAFWLGVALIGWLMLGAGPDWQ